MPDPKDSALVPTVQGELVRASGVDVLLAQVRPEWQAKAIVQRVQRLLAVDPSSACQRIFNAAIHDLREKIVVAGLDIAQEAAKQNKLPAISRAEDVLENYSTSNIIDLAYRMGLLSRPEWRRVRRCYDIRRDLEHEDDEYEAGVEDVVYVFRTAVEAVLSRDPVEILRVEDVKALIDAPKRVSPSKAMLEDFGAAPEPRQREIIELLVNTSLNEKSPDITRQNAVEALRSYRPLARDTVKIHVGNVLQTRIGRNEPELVLIKVAHASGAFPYLKQRTRLAVFEALTRRFASVAFHWKHWTEHGDLLDAFEDVGGFSACPDGPREQLVLWMVKCYIGGPGGYGTYGQGRQVFYSNVAAPRIERLVRAAGPEVAAAIEAAQQDRFVKAAIKNKFIARRLETLLDLAAGEAES